MSDWDDFGTLWRSNEPPELGDLRRRLKRQSFYIKAWFAQEILLAVVAAGFGLWAALNLEQPIIGGGVIAFAVFSLWMSWRVWSGNLTVETGTPGDTVNAALTRNAALQRYIVAHYIISVVAAALIVAMVASNAFGDADDGARLHRALWAVTIGLGSIVVWVAGCGLYAERLRRERERLIALGRALGVSGP